MEILVYAGDDQEARERLLDTIRPVIPHHEIQLHLTLEGLSNRLRQFSEQKILLVILTACKDELLNILLLKNRLDDVPIILILPDRQQETFTAGNRLHPRYVTFADSDFRDVGAVLQKMVARFQ